MMINLVLYMLHYSLV